MATPSTAQTWRPGSVTGWTGPRCRRTPGPLSSRPTQVALSPLLRGTLLCPALVHLVEPRRHLAGELLSPHAIDSVSLQPHGPLLGFFGAAPPPDFSCCSARPGPASLTPSPHRPDVPPTHGCRCHLQLPTSQSQVPPLDSHPAATAHPLLPLKTQTALAGPDPASPTPAKPASASVATPLGRGHQEPGAALDSCSH